MGVPKFYRWISERYPCLSEIVKENQIPEFDNLYLDMNGIIHTCSHPNDEDVHFRMPEEKMVKDIFHYIEVLFRIIRPRKVFFMAVDGVAPRAKMNQQRGRRFRSAKEAIQREKEALSKGEKLPTEKRFDSNCITPGTEFMVRLQEQLAYLVNQKITTDRLWQGIRVYLSGHETPGEGEHKIMDFIRSEKGREGYDPNTRHCLYGLDADLLMLGLVSHEPHFSLLREEVRFGRQAQAQRPTTPEETTFHLLHLSLLREYLAEEFVELKSLPWYDVENIIDDWVMMGFLVGNDFIPNLPNMHINHGALPQLFQIYIKLLPSLNGYINNGGSLHLRRFETFLRALSQHDEDVFKQSMEEFDYLTSKSSKEAWKSQRVQKKQEEQEMRRKLADKNTMLRHAIDLGSNNSPPDLDDDNESVDSLTEELKKSGLQIMDFSEGSDEDCDTSALELKMKKRQYYRDKLEKDIVSDEEVQILAIEYVRAIQWILHYYYNGCQSWSWYYPFHYAPYVSDISGFSNMRFEYDFSRPFLPFQQLLAVLPSASKELLPVAYQGLMTLQDSPIIDYYPEEFEEDLNGKQQSWEAVVKIPFIDEKRLLSAMAERNHGLNDSERKRNTHSEHLLYTYSADISYRLQSSLPGHFPDIPCSHAKMQKIALNKFWVPREDVKKGLCEGVKLGVYYPGFPTLYHLKFESELRKEDVKVFQQNSRGDNMILKIIDGTTAKSADSVHRSLLGKSIYAEWPHMKEVRVVAVADDLKRYELVEGARSSNASVRCINLSGNDVEKFYNGDVATITSHYHKRKGVLIGNTSILVYACPLLGRKYICGNGGAISLEKQWAPDPQAFAYQMIVKDIAVHDSSFKQFKTLGEVFPRDTECFMLGNPHYGAMGKVLETKEDKVTVQFVVPPDPDFHHIMRREQQYQMQYYPAHIIAKKMAVSSHLVSRITGTIFISKGPPPSTGPEPDGKNGSRVNIGLNLKFNKTGEEVPGYTRKEAEGAPWRYSTKLLDVLREYVMSFPEVFEMLGGKKSQSDIFYETDVFGDSPTRLKELKNWLEETDCRKATKAKCGQLALDEPIIKMVEEEVSKASLGKSKKVKMSVRPHLLHRPFDYQGNLVPDPQATYALYDRVINVREGYSVPLGLKGVVVGIQDGATILDKVYEVVFDEEFVGGLKLRCSGYRGYRVSASALVNITYGRRKTQRNEKPLAVVKPQQNEIRFFEPTSSASHTQREGWYANKIGSLGSTHKGEGRPRERTGHQRIQDTAPHQQSQDMAPHGGQERRSHGVHERARQSGRPRERRGPGQQNTQIELPEEPASIPTPPSFAAMVKPGGAQTGAQKAQAVGPEDAKTGLPKYTILRKDEKAGGKQGGGVLRKRERLVKRTSSGNVVPAEGPSEESSTSSEAPVTSPEHSVSPPSTTRRARESTREGRDSTRVVTVEEPDSTDKLAELWEKLKVGEGGPLDIRDRSHDHRGEETVVVGGRISTASDPWRNDDPPSSSAGGGGASNSASIQDEGDSCELLTPEDVWDEESECDSLRIAEEERMTPNTIAKNETKEKLCQLLNLSHITGGVSPHGGELISPRGGELISPHGGGLISPIPGQGFEASPVLTPGKKISVEQLLESSLASALQASFKDAPPNPPPGFARLGDGTSEKMPLPPNTHQLFPSPSVQSNLFPTSAQQPLVSPPGKPLGPAQFGQTLSQGRMGGLSATEATKVPPVQRPTIPEKSAFQPVPQNLHQLPPGFLNPPKQYPQGPRPGPMGAPVGMGMAPQRNAFLPPGMAMAPGVSPAAVAAQFQQFQGMPPAQSLASLGRYSVPPPSVLSHIMSHPPPGLTNRAQPIGPPRTFPQDQQSTNMAGHPGLSYPNAAVQSQQGGRKKVSPAGLPGPAINTLLGMGQPLPQPIGHQLGQQSGGTNPLTGNPGALDRMGSPPGQPGYPPIQPLLESIMNMSGSSAASSENTPSGQPVDTMLNKLRAYCDSKGLRHPNYEYIDTDIIGEYYVIIYLPTGQIVKGERCNGRRNALEVAAFKALKLMRSCPETPEYPGPPPTQFVPLQVTKKLTPRKAPNTDDLLGLNLGLTPPVGGPGHPNDPLGGAAPNQLLFDGQSILSAVLGADQPSAPFQDSLQSTTSSGNLVPRDSISEEQLLGDLLSESRLPPLLHTPLGGQGTYPGSQGVAMGPQHVTPGLQEASMGLQQRGTASQQVSTEQVPVEDQNTIPPPRNESEQSRLTPGAEEGEQGRFPVPKPGGVARTRGRRQGAKGGAKLAINFGGSG